MSCIVYQTNHRTGVVYAYESQSYRDPVTKKSKSHRTYLGRVDPVTGAIVKKAENGKRNRSVLGVDAQKDSGKRIEELEEQVRTLQAEVKELQVRLRDSERRLKQINQLSSLPDES